MRAPPRATDLPSLEGVARTALWTLYCRAAYAERGVIHDPEAIAIRDQLDPMRGVFGAPGPSFALRARDFDRRLQTFLDRHPDASVVSLGEGLETQRFRVTGYGRWCTVDLPEVLAVRARFIPPDDHHRHLPGSASDLAWRSALGDGPAAVVAQGLFMYLPEREVATILRSLADRGNVFVLFDVVPPWLSRLSRLRPPVAGDLRLPPMPWGVSARGLPDHVTRWLGAPVPADALAVWRIPMPSGPVPFRFFSAAAALHLP